MMFGNLIESNSHKGDYARKGSFFLGTLVVYALAFLAIGVGSIYAYNTHVENPDLTVISLVTPADSAEILTPPRREMSRPSNAGNNSPRVAAVRTLPQMSEMDPTRVTEKVSADPPRPLLPTGTDFTKGIPGPGGDIFGSTGNGTGVGSGGTGSGGSSNMEELARETTPPPPMKKEATKPAEVRTISKGVINGQAKYLPRPVYTPLAKAAHASGLVTVQVLIDENGKVVSAHAVSGHPLLLREAVQAAYQARFTPTLLSDQPVKVSGVITYNFVMQ